MAKAPEPLKESDKPKFSNVWGLFRQHPLTSKKESKFIAFDLSSFDPAIKNKSIDSKEFIRYIDKTQEILKKFSSGSTDITHPIFGPGTKHTIAFNPDLEILELSKASLPTHSPFIFFAKNKKAFVDLLEKLEVEKGKNVKELVEMEYDLLRNYQPPYNKKL